MDLSKGHKDKGEEEGREEKRRGEEGRGRSGSGSGRGGRAFSGFLTIRSANFARSDSREGGGAGRVDKEGLFESVGVFAVGAHVEAVVDGEDVWGEGRGRGGRGGSFSE